MTRLQFLFLNFYHILIDGLYDSIPILLTFIVFYFGGNEKQIGLIVSSGSFVATACGLCTLFFARRFDFRQILGFTAFLYGVGFLFNSFSQSMLYSGMFFVVAVAGHTVFHNVSFSFITNKTDRKILGRALSDFTAYGDIGRVPLTALSGYVAAVTISGIAGWRVLCFSYGVLILLVGIALLLIKKKKKEIKEDDPHKRKRVFPSFLVTHNKNIMLVLASSVINAFSSDQIFVFLPSLLLFKGFDHRILGSLAMGFTLGCFIGKTACGRLLDQYGTRKVFVTSQVLLSTLLILLILSNSISSVIIIALLLGIVTKGTIPVIQSMITEPLENNEFYDDIFTLNGFARGGINVLSPILFGVVASRSGPYYAFGIMSASALVTILPMLRIKHQNREG